MDWSIAVRMDHISKQFPNVKALDDVSIDFRKGEIHAIIGENGAGKSTLMKVLYGEYSADTGDIQIGDISCAQLATEDAIKMGIGMVFQEFMLVQEFTVLENIILGFECKKSLNRVDIAQAKQKIHPIIEDYNMQVDLNKKVKDISVGEAQRAEIIKTLYRGAKILILDEPTAVLTPQETEKLFTMLRKMANDGKTIIFISHKLKEVMEISDRISIMRAGRLIKSGNKSEFTIPQLAALMVGHEVMSSAKKAGGEFGEEVLRVEHLHVASDRQASTLKNISLSVHRGEILGIAGVDGNGQSELVEALTGLRKIQKGSIKVLGSEVANLRPRQIRNHHVAHIPEDRNRTGLVRSMTTEENLIATKIAQKDFSRWGILKKKSIRRYVQDNIQRYDIRPNNPRALTSILSGGNAQKIVVAREVEMHTDLLIASQPTRGVDIGSIETIRNTLETIKKEGVAILLVSADLDELLSLSDTIVVLYEGRITGMLKNDENVTEQELGVLMMGGGTA